ncbi:MAG: ABC transporter ATP-binding protein [Elusimicrobia bacterium]|nr:ABC transporter ATP-binding protein [Elusimicrobiota bacterium]
MTPLLEVGAMTVNYGAIAAVRSVSFEVHSGEMVVLLGANGAGKTSILKALSGLIPSGGTARFDGAGLAGVPAHERVARGIAQVPEGRRIFYNLSVKENLLLGGWVQTSKAALKQDLARVLALFPRLEERLGQAGGTLSGGEQQMLAVGRALMSRPKLVVLDEPSMGLSPKLVDAIFAMLAEFHKEGMTLLVVEQNAAMAQTLATRAYVLEAGAIALSGPAAELRDNPLVRRAYLGA